jgi:EAL domain-containing protein (putative c-di-GMP-specific phosphodiesterase class I)
VENEETLLRLKEIGVDFAQGFHLHRPEPCPRLAD